MSINMENPETVLEQIDAAANYVEQIRLAIMMGDKTHALSCVDNAGRLLFNAKLQLEENEE